MNAPPDSIRFALGTFSIAGASPFAGLVIDEERVIAVDALRPIVHAAALSNGASVLALLEFWPVVLPVLQEAVNALAAGASSATREIGTQAIPVRSLRVHPPVAARQLFMSGANYFKHVVDIIVDMGPGKNPGTEGMSRDELRVYAEALMQRRQREGEPYVFVKPISVLTGAYDPIVVPQWAQQPDWELELAVVIGKAARNVSRDDAMSYVAGYTVANDITNRDWIYARGDMKALGTNWLSAKSCPTYLPLGPWIVPASHIANPHDLHLELKLNGETKQDESTSDMIFDIPRLVEYVSSNAQLLPGDVICTGSPAGNGTHYNRFLQPGDIVESTITGLGSQRNAVIQDNR